MPTTPWKTEFVPGAPRLAVDRMGDGPSVIFLHGIGGNRTNWHDQLPAFAAEFHAMSWDARGYGLSDDYEGPLDFADFAHDLKRVLDHFGIAKAHLCGLSMGGRILQDFYPRYADRVATLVLCDTFPGFDASFTPEKRAEFVRLRKEPLVQGKEPKDIAPVVAKTLIGPKSSQAAFDRLVASMTMLHKASYIKTVEATTHYDRTADLPNIKAPTLLVFGGDDRLTPPAIGERMAKEIPDSRLVVIADAGHLPNIERPAEFNAVVLDFLRQHKHRAK
ncbi:MAG TPA: alpha/beta fold hydrolase [Alphaproteobacteria bacterium]|nr:alpha/beta fold hydrolase [Alphaproteobacteria bacterium]